MMKELCEQLEIDTKDICLLCLGSNVDVNGIDFRTSMPPIKLQELKYLLRYLKVNTKELFNCSSEFLQSMEIREDIDLKISLCTKCSSVTQKFNKLYRDYELIQLQFSDCVKSLHESISNGNENPERLRKYKDQMRPTKSADLVNASIAANLRKETLKKCCLKLESVTPRVRVAETLEKTEVENRLNLPRQAGVQCSSGDSQVPENEAHSGPSLGIRIESSLDKLNPHPNETKYHPNAEPEIVDVPDDDDSQINKSTNNVSFVPKPDGGLLQHGSIRFSQMSSETLSGVATQPKSVKTNLSCKQTIFNSIKKKKKFKTKPRPTASTSNSVGVQNSLRKNLKACQYCNTLVGSCKTLKRHIINIHPEYIVRKFLPRETLVEFCRRALNFALEQMKHTSGLGFTCKFCDKDIYRYRDLKIHLLSVHVQEIAQDAQQYIGVLPSEVSSHDASGSTSTLRSGESESAYNSLREDISNFNQSYGHVEMDFEEESCIKIENPPLEDVELDPLNFD